MAAAKALGPLDKLHLTAWLKALEAHNIDPATIHLYQSVPCNPPWQRGFCTGGLIVIFRKMTELERQQVAVDGEAPQYYVAFVVRREGEAGALAQLKAKLEGQEREEEREEEERAARGEQR